MNYDHPELRDRLAGEYVLGALRGRARIRFERLLAADAELRRRVREWEERLTPLAAQTRAVEPPSRVFLALKSRLEAAPRAARAGLWERLGFWRALSATAVAVALALGAVLGITLVRTGALPTGPSYVAVLADESARPVLAVTSYNKPSWRIEIEPLSPLAGAEGRVLQLWAVARDTGAVQPLATVAPGHAQRRALSEAEWKLVKGAADLLVTLEPAAGARAPSGPVLYRGPCINLKGPVVS
jgi:anti-sigma-K factor RskA